MAIKVRRSDAEIEKEAENLVRRILVTDFGQRLDAKTVKEVAKRVRQSLAGVRDEEKLSA
jgi:hypothetical protein